MTIESFSLEVTFKKGTNIFLSNNKILSNMLTILFNIPFVNVTHIREDLLATIEQPIFLDLSHPQYDYYISKLNTKNVYTIDPILQQAIDSKTIENCKYDYRVLVQKLDFAYKVAGIGIRLADKNHYTTHTRHGGTIYPYKKLLMFRSNISFIKLEKKLLLFSTNKIKIT